MPSLEMQAQRKLDIEERRTSAMAIVAQRTGVSGPAARTSTRLAVLSPEGRDEQLSRLETETFLAEVVASLAAEVDELRQVIAALKKGK
jgi:uncharacterized membrane-anchored protein